MAISITPLTGLDTITPLTGLDTTTAIPIEEAAPPVLGIDESPPPAIPQTPAADPVAGNPLLGTFGPDPSMQADADYEETVQKWRRDTQAKVDTAALDPDGFYQGDDLSFARTPKEAQILATNDAFLTLQKDGEPLPHGDMNRRLYRQKVAIEQFGGAGADSEESFHGQVVKQAQGRKDGKELVKDLQVAAFNDAMLPETGPQSYAAWRAKAKTLPGYDANREADYSEAWHESRSVAKEKVDKFRQPLVHVWRAFKTDGNVTAAAFDAWKSLTPEQRPEFLDALAIRAKALPDEERATFWANMGRQTELAISDYGRQAAESATSLTLAEPTPMAVGIADAFYGTENYPVEEAGRKQAQADFQQRRNFAGDVRRIAREDYDPLKSAFGEGKPGFWEGVAYQAPGVTGISLTMAVPVIGMGAMTFAMEGQAYETLRGRMLSSGKDDATATAYAEGLAPLVALPQAALEKAGFAIWSRKMPGFSKLMDTLGDRIANRALRFGAKVGTITTAETGIELLQDVTSYAVQDIGHALENDIPDVQWLGKGGALDGTWAQAPEIFATMLPLAILGAAGGLSQESRDAAFKASSTTQKQALGMTAEGIAAIEAAQGPNSLSTAIDEGWETRDATTPEAKAASAALVVQQTQQRRAQENLEKIGYVAPRFVQTADGITVFDGQSGEELGQAPDLGEALRIARDHTVALDDLETDQVAHLGTLMEAARAAAELDPQSAVEINLGDFDPEQATPEMAARFAAQVALKEQAEGGTGNIARSVLGYSVTEFAQGLRTTVNKLFRASSVTDVFHETFHVLRRQALAAGTLTRADEIAVLRGLDTVLAGRTTKDGTRLSFLPAGVADADLTEIAIDEAIAEIAEMELLKTRKGQKSRLGVTRGVVSRNLTALAKLVAPGALNNWRKFMAAVRTRWGLSLSRALAIKKAERDGKFDAAGYDAYLDKLLGLDAQVEHDGAVQQELNRILALPDEMTDDDIPFSIGPATVAEDMAKSALERITDPRRKTQIMSRIARDFNAMRLQIERIASLRGIKRSKGDMRNEANAREDLAAEEKIAAIHQRYGSLLADEDLVKIKSQPIHEHLGDPTTHLRGRLMSKAAAIRLHPDMFQLHRAGEYDGSDGVSRSVFGGSLMPDQAAQELFDHHLIKEPTADAMWEALMVEQNTVAGFKEMLVKAQEEIRAAKLEAKQEANEWLATQSRDQETNFSDKEEIRRSLRMLDAILLALPAEIRGKIGGYTQISMITTDDARLAYLKDKLAKADKELETYLRVEYGKEFEGLLKRAAPKTNEPGQRPTGSIAADAYDILTVAENAMGLSFAKGEALADAYDAEADHPDTDPKAADIARVKAQMVRLTMNWTAADAARREQAVLEGEKIYFGGLAGLAVENSRRRERLKTLRTSAITGTKKTGSRMERKASTKGAKGNKAREALQMAWEFLSFGQVVNVLFGENSAAAKWFNGMELAASNAMEDAFQAKANALESLFVTLSGNRFGGEKLRHKMATEESITVKDALGETHTFTDAEAITFLLMWRQEDGKRHMQGIVDEETQAITSSWAWDDKSAAAVEAGLSPQGKAVLAFLGQSYGEEYGRINAVFRRIWNVSMPRHKMYAPLSVAPASGKADTVMDPVSGDPMGTGMTPGSLKNRSFSAIAEPLFKDAFQVYLSHARQMEHFIAYGEFARDAIAVVNRREARNAIEAAGGPFAAGVLSKWLDFFATGGVKDPNVGGAISKTVGGVLGRLSQAALVGRASVIVMQSLQLVAAAYQMPTGAFLSRLARLHAGRLNWWLGPDSIIHSEYIQRRISIMPPVVRDAVQGLASGTPNRAKYYAAELGKTISGADALFTAGTYAIFYDYHLGLAKKTGIPNPEAHAHAEAERLTDQVAQPTRAGARSWSEVSNQGNPAYRAMWNFSSDPRQKAALIVYEAMRRDKSGAEKAAAVGKALTLTWLVTGVLSTLLRAIMRDIRDDDDKDVIDERHWDATRLGMMALTGPFAAMPYVGEVLEHSTYKATGQYMPQGGLLSAIGDAFGVVPSWFEGDFDVLKDTEKILTAGAAASGTSAALTSAMHIIRDVFGIVENAEGPD